MKKIALITSFFFMANSNAQVRLVEVSAKSSQIVYPKTTQVKHIDNYFGTEIDDVYHWLEDDRSKETEAWVKSQNEVTNSYLDKIPFRNELKERMTKLWNYEKISAPFVEGNYTYYYKNNGLQNQSVLYRQDKKGVEQVFLDPNTFSKDGTTSLDQVSFSKNGAIAAYSISESGSDWRKVIFLDVITMKKKTDILIDVKFSGLSWKGNEGVFYSSYDKVVACILNLFVSK